MSRQTETAAHPGDTAGPFAFGGHAAFEGKAEFDEELNHDADASIRLTVMMSPWRLIV